MSAAQLKPGQGIADDGGVLAVQPGGQLIWTPTKAQRQAFREARSVRVEVSFEAREGAAINPLVWADWGEGFSEISRAALNDGPNGLFAVLPARGRQLLRLRLDPSDTACKLTVTRFDVSVSGALGADPRGAAGPLIDALKPVLGPLREPIAAAYRKLRGLGAKPKGPRPPRGGGAWRETYLHANAVARNLRSVHYGAPIADQIRLKEDAPKLVAFYLPQFHPFPENEAWWGKGFTEWTNVSKAQPQFVGHYQPRLPADLGFYDLRHRAPIAQQVELAKRAGISAFCFHYYWFAGKRLMETPIELYLADPSLDLPFCLCWANENWSRRWDGQEQDILIAQQHSPEDDLAVFRDLARHMVDPRYLKIGGKPVLVVYRPELFPEAKATTERWRVLARELGLGEIRLLCTTAFGFSDYESHGFDGIIDFPPHAIDTDEITDKVTPLHAEFTGKVFDFPRVVERKLEQLRDVDSRFVPGVMPGWDNHARKPWSGHAFHDADPPSYLRWLSGALRHAETRHPPGEAVVFVNAWNEWAEGAYLEPDRWFGHGYLHATRTAMSAYASKIDQDHPLLVEAQAAFVKRSDTAVLLHLYYPELIDWFAERLASLAEKADVLISVSETWSAEDLVALRKAFPQAYVFVAENRGRDIRPFVEALRRARTFGYDVFCKLHSKRSPDQAKGDAWRTRLVDGLAGPEATQAALTAFAGDPKLGLLAAADARMRMGDPGVMDNNWPHVERLSASMGLKPQPETPFAAGSMFWGRVAAFAPLADLADDAIGFEPETGRVDGATAHAIERLTAAIVERAGYRMGFEL